MRPRKVLLIAFLTLRLSAAAEFPKAFLSNGQIWIQMTAAESPHQVTHDDEGGFKSDPVVSPDGSLIAYGYSEKPVANHLPPLKIVFIDWSAKEIRRFNEIPTQKVGGVCGYGYAEWIDGARIGVRCEAGPSGNDYVIVNATSGKVEKELPGLYFSWSPDHQTLAHIGWIVHFAPPSSQNNCVLFNDKIVYTPGCSSDIEPTVKPQKRPSHGVPFDGRPLPEARSDFPRISPPLHFEISTKYLLL